MKLNNNKQEFYTTKKDNRRNRAARKKDWNSLNRYCDKCFFQLTENQIGAAHESYALCIEARDKGMKQDPQLFKKLSNKNTKS